MRDDHSSEGRRRPRFLYENVDDPLTELLERAARARLVHGDAIEEANLDDLRDAARALRDDADPEEA